MAGITTEPDTAFMAQIARNLTDPVDGFLREHRFVICDRDAKFATSFRSILDGTGITVVRTPRQAPNGNAYAERFVLSIKSECLNRLMLFGEAASRRALGEYLQHYQAERPHQGLGNDPLEVVPRVRRWTVRCRERLGGLLRHYDRVA